MANKNGFWQTH